MSFHLKGTHEVVTKGGGLTPIVAITLPNMGLKVSFGKLKGLLCFGCSCGVLAVS